MESLLSIEFRVRHNRLPSHPIVGHFLEIVQAMPMAVLVDHSVDNPQASRADCESGFPVWLPHDIALDALAVRDAWIRELEKRGVDTDALVSPTPP